MILKELFDGLPYALPEDDTIDISDVVYDSRKIVPGCLFVCLKGAKADGHRFAEDAEKQGAAAILAEDPVDVSVPVILAQDTRKALAEVSAAYFHHPAEDLCVIGLTGTKGKTTTAWMIRSILEHAGHKTGLIGTIGTVIGGEVIKTNNTTPQSYELQKFLRMMADAGCEAAVIEASSIGLRAHRTGGMTFDYGLFSNFSHDHIGGVEHKDMEEYLQCKQMLFRQCKTGIINIDDPSWQRIIEGHTCEIETYGFAESADFRGSDAELLRSAGYLGVKFTMTHNGASKEIRVGIPGKFSVYNALAAAAVCSHFGVTEADVNEGLAKVKVKGRVEIVPTDGDYTLLIDYAHNALAMESVLKTLREYQPHRLICMFGAGGNRPKVRRFEMGQASGSLADLSVITADNSRDEDVMDIIADIQVGMAKTGGRSVVVPDRREAIRYCIENAEPGDIIVLAGKGHEDYQEIKGVKYHFDEREIVAEILQSRSENKGE